MNITSVVYNELKQKVTFLYHKLGLFKYEKTKGRKLSIPIIDCITLGLYKQASTRATKKSLWNDYKDILRCSYKTLVVNLNRFFLLTLILLFQMLRLHRGNAHPIKHTDSTDIPVCLNKNAAQHKTMSALAGWGYSGKGLYYGLRLHLTADLFRKILSFSFTPAGGSERKQFVKINKDLEGIFVADAGYVSETLAREFYRENRRILFTKPRKNMKKLMTAWQSALYDTRMLVELNFRNLKMLFGLVTSFPRSINGYIGNYLYSLLAYVLR